MRLHVHAGARALVLLAVTVGLGACASGGAVRPEGATPDLIVRAELVDYDDRSAYEAVQRLRSSWLRVRQGTDPAVVYLDGTRLGSIDRLYSIRAAQVVEMERVNATDATTRFGTGHTGGAILVRTR